MSRYKTAIIALFFCLSNSTRVFFFFVRVYWQVYRCSRSSVFLFLWRLMAPGRFRKLVGFYCRVVAIVFAYIQYHRCDTRRRNIQSWETKAFFPILFCSTPYVRTHLSLDQSSLRSFSSSHARLRLWKVMYSTKIAIQITCGISKRYIKAQANFALFSVRQHQHQFSVRRCTGRFCCVVA